METNSKKLCRLCLEASADTVNVFDNFEDSTIVSILAKYFWFTVSKNDFSEYLCEVCWTNVKSFHNFYKRVERLHRMFSVATEEMNSFQQQQNDCISSQPDLNIVKCEETELQLDLHIKNEECSDSDIVYISYDEIEDVSHSSDDFDQSYNKSRAIDGESGVENKGSGFECNSNNGNEAPEESHQFVTQFKGRKKKKRSTATEYDAKIREFFDLKCNICSDDVEFATFKELNQHYSSIHQTRGFVKCCGSTLQSSSSMIAHIRKHSTGKAQQDAQIREFFDLKCKICSGDDKFQTFKEFRQHYRSVHKTRGVLKCCTKTMRKRCHLVQHIQYHLNPDAFRCDRCGKQCTDSDSLRNHIQSHTLEQSCVYSCYQCTKSYTKVTSLKQHMDYKHPIDGKTFPCDNCNKVFPTKLSLEIHIRNVHANPLALICDICAQSCKSKLNFELHMKSHTTQPKVQCNVCGIWSANVYALRKHVQNQHNTHNDVKVNCPTCNKVLRNKQKLKAHIRTVHCESKHKCPVCNKGFKLATILKEHISSIHTGGYLYDCGYCPKKFNSNANMHSHRKKVHFDEWSQEIRNGIPKKYLLSKWKKKVDGTK